MSVCRSRGFVNYPVPKAGPAVPFKNERKPNPPLRGVKLVVSAWIMENVPFVRNVIWHNAGFGSLRSIRHEIEEYEPRYDPTVLPMPQSLDAAPAAAPEVPPPPSFTPKYHSVADYHALFMSGEITPLDVAYALLPMIRRDVSPPGEHSNAWFDTNVDMVLEAATQSTQRYREKQPLGLLDGCPTAIKDEYDMDGYTTCLGSKHQYTHVPAGESSTTWCVRKLEETGAVIYGKLSMHEYGLDTTGNNPNHQTPRNPYCDDYYTGGSSSGCGYAVAAGLIPIAIGSDGGGSIRIPSAWCGIYGLKPTHGRISFKPGPNYSVTCAVNGPMAADVRSLAALYEVMAQPDPTCQFQKPSPFALRPSEQRPKLLGIPRAWFDRADETVKTLCYGMIDKLEKQYEYTTVDIEIPFLAEGQIAHAMTVLTDGATLLPDTSKITPANKILLSIGRTTPSTDYLLAQKLRGVIMQHLAHLWTTHPGMIIVTPTTSAAGWRIETKGELKHGINDGTQTLKSMEFVWLGNFCGIPGMTVPVGYEAPSNRPNAGGIAPEEGSMDRLPVGLMGYAEWADEQSLLEWALDAEEALGQGRCKARTWVDLVEWAKDGRKVQDAGADSA